MTRLGPLRVFLRRDRGSIGAAGDGLPQAGSYRWQRLVPDQSDYERRRSISNVRILANRVG
jgi:hypothetical protein